MPRFWPAACIEPDDLPGLAYLTGRVIDRGTERRTADVIAGELDQRGVSLRVGDDTPHDDAVVHVPRRGFRGRARDRHGRRTGGRPFPTEELAKRRAEVDDRVASGRGQPGRPRGRGASQNCCTAPDIPTAGAPKEPSKGSSGSIALRLSRFHARYVRPAVLSLAVVGDVDADACDRLAAMELEGWTGAPAGPVVVATARRRPVRRVRMIAMPGKAQTDIAYGFTTISRLDPRYYAYWMMNNILGQFGLGGRLADNIRERQGMAYYAFSSFDPTVGEGPLVVRAGVDPKNVERAIEAIDSEVRQLGERRPNAARSRRNTRVPDRIDSAAARNQLQHRRIPAELRTVRPRSRLRSAPSGASRICHHRRDRSRCGRGAVPRARGRRDCRSRSR